MLHYVAQQVGIVYFYGATEIKAVNALRISIVGPTLISSVI